MRRSQERQAERCARMRHRQQIERRRKRKARTKRLCATINPLSEPPATPVWFDPERDLPAWFHVLSQLNPYMRFTMYGARVT